MLPETMIKSFVNATTDDFNKVLLETRKYISYGNLTMDTLIDIDYTFIKYRNTFEVLLFHYANYRYYKWPHQDLFNAFMGHLFFPVQFEYIHETPIGLTLRHCLQDLLALSAFYGNTLAQVRMVDILNRCFPVNIDENDNEIIQNTSFLEYFGLYYNDYLQKYISKNGNAPFYFGGLLCMCYTISYSREYFKAGYYHKDPLCTFRHALWLKNSKREKVCRELLTLDKGLGLMLSDGSTKNKESRIKIYLEAGENGIAEGYLLAGIMTESDGSDKSKDRALAYYRLAAENHILGAYERVAEICLEKGDIIGAKKAYKTMGEKGDYNGYIKLGDLYLAKKKVWLFKKRFYAKILDCYKKAGLYGYHKRMEVANKTGENIEELRMEENDMSLQRYNFLLKICTGQ